MAAGGWQGMNERKSEIRLQLKDVSGDIFAPGDVSRVGRNELVLRMQPRRAFCPPPPAKNLPGRAASAHTASARIFFLFRMRRPLPNTALLGCPSDAYCRRLLPTLIAVSNALL